MSDEARDGQHDFDFLFGSWKVQNRRLAGCTQWEEFGATAIARPLLGGLDHVDARFIWSGMTRAAARWEQAFSDDGGRAWETNWTMAFTRIAGT